MKAVILDFIGQFLEMAPFLEVNFSMQGNIWIFPTVIRPCFLHKPLVSVVEKVSS